MKRIVLVTNIPSPYRVDLFYYMQTTLVDYEFHVIYTNKTEENRAWTIEKEKLINSVILNSKVVRLNGSLDNHFIHIPVNIGKILSKIKPDVVIAWEYNIAAIQSLIWCTMNGVPLIHLTDGTLNSEKSINFIQKLCRKIVVRGASAFIASSTMSKKKLLSYGAKEESIFVSLLTVNQKQYESVDFSYIPGRLLYVGSFVKRKGLDLLITSLQYLNENWTLHIVGNGSEQEKNELKKLAKSLKIEDRIVWCGFKEGTALVQEYKESNVFVFPTRQDCFGLVLLEALYSGTPIVSSIYADGAYDIVKTDVNGLMADPYHAKEFASAIECVLKNCKYKEEAKKAEYSKFLFSNVAKGYCDAIQYALTKH